jgi:hypothetical protein
MPDSNTPRSRRSVLVAAAGAAVATAASALDPQAAVRAGTDGDVVLGAANTATTTTSLAISANDADVLRVSGMSENAAIVGVNTDTGAGVRGEASFGAGVLGTSQSGTGVEGAVLTGNGILGVSEEGSGVVGHITLSGSGVHGHSFSTAGVGVRATAEAGRALVVVGKASFSRSGRATVPTGASYVDVSLVASGGLSGTPLCFANLQTRRPGIHVEAVRPNTPTAGTLRIYLNKAVPGATFVSWLVLN